jgi:CRISPR-associated protein Cmr2
MAHVLIVTLGPIQDFIAAARRTRDLWFGSWLLSELSKATARAMALECGIESLVFPGISKPGELEPASSSLVANKIVIRVPAGKDPAAVAAQGKEGMQKRLDELRDQAFKEIASLHFDSGKATDQVNDLIELAWVSAPEQGEDGYDEARKRAEALLAARKNTRLWSKVTWGAEVPKSSIDGERESVLHEKLFENVGKEGGLSPEEVRKRYGVEKTERLCGVGLLKRHGIRQGWNYAHRFLSTGHLAAWPIYARTRELDDPGLRAAWEDYLAVLRRGGVDLEEQKIVQPEGWRHNNVFGKYDGSLLFEGRLTDLFEEVAEPGRQAGLRDARKALAAFLQKLGVSTPLPYYAILVADGDSMGKAIERQKTFKDHQDLSQALDGFAQNVRSTVEQKGGELVYAGGDDVLAFVPLHQAIDCARELARNFHQRLSKFPAEEDRTPTLSAGVGISHFMDPLRGALRLARKAETLAKKKKNSLAVIVDKRSGPPVEVTGVWGTLDKQLDDYTDLHRVDYVPDGAAYELRELARLLEGAKGTEREPLENLMKAEARRILGRKQPAHGAQSKIDPKVFRRIAEEFETTPVAEVADQLIVARLLAQAKDEAGVPLPPPEIEPEGAQP